MYTISKPSHFIHAGNPYTFEEFVKGIIARSMLFTRDYNGLLAAQRILKSPYRLTPKDWSLLKQAVENPTGGYPIPLPHRLVPFIEAVANAVPDPEPVVSVPEICDLLPDLLPELEPESVEAAQNATPDIPEPQI